MHVSSLIALTTLLFATPSLAGEQAREPDPRDEIICKSVASETGSRLGSVKKCQTRRQWDERQVEGREAAENIQQNWGGSQ